MKVRLLTSLAGDGFSYDCNAEAEFSAAEAERLIAGGFALPVEADPIPEAAPTAPVEAAPVSEPKRRKRG